MMFSRTHRHHATSVTAAPPLHAGRIRAALAAAAALALVVGCGGEPEATGRVEEAVTLPALPTALALEGPAVALTGTCSPWKVATVRSGTAGAPVAAQAALDTAVDVTASGGATLHADAGCLTSLGGSVTVPANAAIAPFWVRSASPTGGTITATTANLDDATASYEVADLGTPAAVAITLAPIAAAGACVPMTVRLIDANGFRVVTAVPQDVELWAGSGSFYADPACVNGLGYGPILSIAPGRGSLRVWTKALAGNDYRMAWLATQTPGANAPLTGRAASKLALTGPAAIGPGQCKAITIKATDDGGQAAPVAADLSIALGGAGAGTFYADRLCSTAITATTITAGRSSRAVYFADPATEELTLTADGLGTATLPLVVAAPTRIAVTGDPLIASGTVGVYTVKLQALVGTRYVEVPSDQDVAVRLTHTGDGTACYVADCGPATEMATWVLAAGTARFTFYFRQPTPPAGGAQVVTLAAADESGALTTGTFNVTVIAPTTPTGLRVVAPAGAIARAGTCARVDVTVLDASGAVVATPTAMPVKLTGGATVVYTSDTCVTPLASRTVTIAPGGTGASFHVRDPAIEAVTVTATGRFTVAGVNLVVTGKLPLSMKGELAITGGPFAPLAAAHVGLCQGAAVVVRDGVGAPTIRHPAFTATLALPPTAEAFAGDGCSGSSTSTLAVSDGSGGVTFSYRLRWTPDQDVDWVATLRATASSPLVDQGGAVVPVHLVSDFSLSPAGPHFVDDGDALALRAIATWTDGLVRDLTEDPLTAWGSEGPAVTAEGLGQFVAAEPGWVSPAYAAFHPFGGIENDAGAPVAETDVWVGPPHTATVTAAATLTVGATAPARYRGTWRTDLSLNGWSVDDLAAAWASDHPDVATVDAATGVITGVAPGVATITGTFKGVAASAPVTIGAPTLVMSPPALVIPQGATAAFTTATATGADLTAASVWSTSDATVATVAGGTVTAIAVGTAVVTATYGDGPTAVSASRPITVVPPAVRSLAIAPIDKLIVGAAAPLAVTATYTDGTTADVSAEVDWTSSSSTVAWASTASRRVIGRTRGVATLTASYGGATATRAVEVYGLDVPGGGVLAGATRAMTATLVSPTGVGTAVTNQVTWSIEYTAAPGVVVATIDPATGVLTGVATGLVAVRARFPAGSGYQGSWLAPVAVNAAPTLLSMRIVADDGSDLAVPTTMARGEVRRLRAFGTFVTAGVQTVAEMTEPLALTWTSAAPATVTSFGSGWFGAIAAPSAPSGIEVSVTGAAMGAPFVRATARLATVASTVTRVDVTPSYLALPADARARYRAVARHADGTTADVTAAATWSSSDPTVADVDATGDAGALAAGTATLSASFGGLTATARLDVTAASVVWLLPGEEAPSVVGRGTRQCHAIGALDDGGLLDLTRAADWTTADPAIATVGSTPGDRGLARGSLVAAPTSTTITATVRGIDVSTQATLTVRPPTLTAIALASTYTDALTLSITAMGTWSDGGPSSDVTQTATWASSDPAIATVLSPGVVRVAASGQATITATQAGVSASIVVTAAGR